MAHDDGRDAVAALIALLRRLPPGAEIVWGSEYGGEGDWINGSWCDIWAPDLARPLGLNWVWTIQTPRWEVDEPLEPSDWYITLAGTRREEGGEPGWSVATVNEALHGWVAFHAGRPDLRLRYDDDLVSDWMREIVERDRGDD